MIWLALRMFASQPSISVNYSLILSLQWSFNYKWVEEVNLLDIRLVTKLVTGASSQLKSLSVKTILGPKTGETV